MSAFYELGITQGTRDVYRNKEYEGGGLVVNLCLTLELHGL